MRPVQASVIRVVTLTATYPAIVPGLTRQGYPEKSVLAGFYRILIHHSQRKGADL